MKRDIFKKFFLIGFFLDFFSMILSKKNNI